MRLKFYAPKFWEKYLWFCWPDFSTSVYRFQVHLCMTRDWEKSKARRLYTKCSWIYSIFELNTLCWLFTGWDRAYSTWFNLLFSVFVDGFLALNILSRTVRQWWKIYAFKCMFVDKKSYKMSRWSLFLFSYIHVESEELRE